MTPPRHILPRRKLPQPMLGFSDTWVSFFFHQTMMVLGVPSPFFPGILLSKKTPLKPWRETDPFFEKKNRSMKTNGTNKSPPRTVAFLAFFLRKPKPTEGSHPKPKAPRPRLQVGLELPGGVRLPPGGLRMRGKENWKDQIGPWTKSCTMVPFTRVPFFGYLFLTHSQLRSRHFDCPLGFHWISHKGVPLKAIQMGMGQNSARNWTAGLSPWFHLPGQAVLGTYS